MLFQDELFLRKATESCSLQQTFLPSVDVFILYRLHYNVCTSKFSEILFAEDMLLLLIFFRYFQVFIMNYFGQQISN